MYHHCLKETGCGKTTLIQRLSELSGHNIVVQNLSLQTDSTDLLGGYRPLELHHIGRRVYTEFVDLFAKSYSRMKNAEILDRLTRIFEKGDWKKLSTSLQKISKKWFDMVRTNLGLRIKKTPLIILNQITTE